MKKINKILTLIISLFVGIGIVSASDLTTKKDLIFNKTTQSGSQSMKVPSDYKVRNGNYGYSLYKYVITESNGDEESYAGYCIDPHLTSGITSNLEVVRILGTDSYYYDMDNGILEIIKKADANGTKTIDADFMNANFALRTLVLGLYGDTLDGFDLEEGKVSVKEFAIAAHIDIAADWIESSKTYIKYANKILGTNLKKGEFKDYLLDKFINSHPTVGKYFNDKDGVKYYMKNNGSGVFVDKSKLSAAKSYFVAGLTAAYKAKIDTNPNKSAVSLTPSITLDGTAKDYKSEGKTYYKEIRFDIDFKNFDMDTASMKIDIKCTNCKENNVITVNDKNKDVYLLYDKNGKLATTNTIEKINSYINKHIKDFDGKFYIVKTVNYTLTDDKTCAENIKFDLTVEGKDKLGAYTGALVNHKPDGKTYSQRFIIGQKTDADLKETKEVKFNIGLCDKTFCVKKNDTCYVCENDKYNKKTCKKVYDTCKETIEHTNTDVNCNTKDYCIKENDVCYMCPNGVYSSDCEAIDCATGATKAKYGDPCRVNTFCVQPSTSSTCYVCPTDTYDSRCKAASSCTEALSEATKNASCGGCNTSISSPTCSIDASKSRSVIDGPTDIKTCLLNKGIDDAGNTYELAANNGGVSSSNPYCKVYCKEDYDIQLNPVVENVQCGTYFKLTSGVSGSKTCYTTGLNGVSDGNVTSDNAISEKAFFDNMDRIQSELVEQTNLYLYYKSQASIVKIKTTDYCSKTYYGADYESTIPYDVYSYSRNGSTFETRKSSTNNNYTNSFIDEYDSWSCNCMPVLGGGQSCSTCCKRKSLYYDEKANNFIEDAKEKMNDAQAKIESLVQEYNQHITWFNECSNGWTNKYKFDQKIGYTYNEYQNDKPVQPYNTGVDYLVIDKNKAVSANSITEIYNSGTMNNQYVGAGSVTSTPSMKSQGFVKCSTSGCENVTESISKARYVKKTESQSASYITPTKYYQIEGSGKITLASLNGPYVKTDPLVNGLPVSDNATGGGQFHLFINSLGEFYGGNKAGQVGRLIDYNGDNEAYSVAYKQHQSNAKAFDGNYVCNYESPCESDCPNCEFICTETGCEWEECPNCDFRCSGNTCLFDNGKLELNPKTITSTKVLSANRAYGYNWLRETSGIAKLELLSKKAAKTIEEIEKYNETIYNTTESKIGTSEGLAFSIKLTPEITKLIQEYNKEQINLGGYANDSITCYDATINGVKYKNIFCYSDFIDTLMANNADNITVKNRTEKAGRSDNNNAANSSGYWTLWSDFGAYANNSNVIGGPSWK